MDSVIAVVLRPVRSEFFKLLNKVLLLSFLALVVLLLELSEIAHDILGLVCLASLDQSIDLGLDFLKLLGVGCLVLRVDLQLLGHVHEVGLEPLGVDYLPRLDQLQAHHKYHKPKSETASSLLLDRDADAMAVQALRLEKFVHLIHQERVENWHSEVDVAHVSWARVAVEAASHAPRHYLARSLAYIERGSKGETPMVLS